MSGPVTAALGSTSDKMDNVATSLMHPSNSDAQERQEQNSLGGEGGGRGVDRED